MFWGKTPRSVSAAWKFPPVFLSGGWRGDAAPSLCGLRTGRGSVPGSGFQAERVFVGEGSAAPLRRTKGGAASAQRAEPGRTPGQVGTLALLDQNRHRTEPFSAPGSGSGPQRRSRTGPDRGYLLIDPVQSDKPDRFSPDQRSD